MRATPQRTVDGTAFNYACVHSTRIAFPRPLHAWVGHERHPHRTPQVHGITCCSVTQLFSAESNVDLEHTTPRTHLVNHQEDVFFHNCIRA
jgi:hypothetical protein